MLKKSKYYFISYHYSDENDNGFGNCYLKDSIKDQFEKNFLQYKIEEGENLPKGSIIILFKQEITREEYEFNTPK